MNPVNSEKNSNSFCDKYSAMLFDYIDGQLEKSQADEVKNHIETCEYCRNELEICKKTLKLIRSSAYQPDRNLQAAISHKIISFYKSNWNRRILRYGTAIAACVAFVAVITHYTFFNFNLDKSNNATYDMAATQGQSQQAAENAENPDNENEALLKSVPEYSHKGGVSESAQDDLEGTGAADRGTEESASGNAATPSLLMPEIAMAGETSDTAVVIDNFTLQYAPQYAGLVCGVFFGQTIPASEAESILPEEAFTVYVYEYSDDNLTALSKVCESSYIDDSYIKDTASDNVNYLLYIILK